MDESAVMSESIYITHTQDNGGAHKLHQNERLQLPFTTHEYLVLTSEY